VAAVRAGRSVYRCSLAELIEALTKAEREGRLVEKIRFYTRASLLIVDEIGYLPITPGAPTSSSSSSMPATKRAP
jgi:DNA replication protein DnaC